MFVNKKEVDLQAKSQVAFTQSQNKQANFSSAKRQKAATAQEYIYFWPSIFTDSTKINRPGHNIRMY